MSASTFRQLLSQTSETVERPRALAPGHYIGTIKATEFGTSRAKQTPFLRLLLTPEEETDDVPPGANEGIDFSRKELRVDYYITPTSNYRIADMLDAVLGLHPHRSIDERIPDLRGQRVIFVVSQRESEDGKEVYNDVGNRKGDIIAA